MRFILILLVFVCAALPQERPARVGVGIIERKLALDDAIAKALSSNLEIEIERTNLATASQSLRAAEGAFDPVFRWQPLLQSRTTPTPNVLTAADGRLAERFHSQNFYFLQKLPWRGTSFHVDFENNRQSTTNPFVTLTPFVVSRLGATLVVPLVRNREIDRERAADPYTLTLELANTQQRSKTVEEVALNTGGAEQPVSLSGTFTVPAGGTEKISLSLPVAADAVLA